MPATGNFDSPLELDGDVLTVTGSSVLNSVTAGAGTFSSLAVTGGNFKIESNGNTTVSGTL